MKRLGILLLAATNAFASGPCDSLGNKNFLLSDDSGVLVATLKPKAARTNKYKEINFCERSSGGSYAVITEELIPGFIVQNPPREIVGIGGGNGYHTRLYLFSGKTVHNGEIEANTVIVAPIEKLGQSWVFESKRSLYAGMPLLEGDLVEFKSADPNRTEVGLGQLTVLPNTFVVPTI